MEKRYRNGRSYGGNNLESFFVAMLAFVTFSIVKDRNPQSNKLVNFVAEYSFGAYLIHMFWLKFSRYYFGIWQKEHPEVSIELLFAYA